jgi:CTP:phosphocholine cytidylyltransferase-like protein
MKNFLMIALFAIGTATSYSQRATDEVALLQSVYGMQKRDIVAKYMELSGDQATTFWALYEEYEVARKAIGVKRANNIMEYAKNYESITDENVSKMVKASLEVSKDYNKLWDKTYKKMTKSLNARTAAKFYQLELYLENMVRNELSESIPMIDQLK